MHLLGLLLDTIRGIVRYIAPLLRSAYVYFRFRHYFGHSGLKLPRWAQITSYVSMAATECKGFFESCYSRLKQFAQAAKSFLCSLLQPCFAQRYRSSDYNYEDAVSITSDDVVSSLDFAKMHAAFSPARAGCWNEKPQFDSDNELGSDDELNNPDYANESTALLRGYDSSSDDIDYQTIKKEARSGSHVVTSALVHKVKDTCSDREISV
ncbi:hypothetical protein [Anaplasma bovis]|uniref:hypothetical protein n=1 Tax=Anaplasma bovis TaxID=186733 RepID=UPI002FEEBD7D